jgi:hypothetical protein
MGAPFASLIVSDPIPCPFDAGQWVIVRKLTGRQIEAAQAAHAGAMADGGARTWAARFRRILERAATPDAEILQAIADPLTGYDRFALVRAGLVAWSYPQKIHVRAEKGSDVLLRKADQEARDAIVDDLDDESIDFIATEVLRLTKPALFFATQEDAERAQKELSAAAPAA